MKKHRTTLIIILGISALYSCTKKQRENRIIGSYYVSSYLKKTHSENSNNSSIDENENMNGGSTTYGDITYDNNGYTTINTYEINNSVFEYDFNKDKTWTKRWNRTKSFYFGITYSEIAINEITSGTWDFNQETFSIDLATLKTVKTNQITLEVDEINYTTEHTITYYLDFLKQTEMSITRKEESGCTNSECTNTTLETIHLIEN